MNWLAHLLLAGPRADDRLGGVLADLVSMPVARTLPAGLRRGIALHQSVDAFCDAHPAVLTSNRRLCAAGVGLRPAAAAIAVDMLYDHLLARDWPRWCPGVGLEAFAEDFYRTAERHAAAIPPEARLAFQFMRAENWLASYRELAGVRTALERIRGRLSPRAAAASPLASAAEVFAADPAGFAEDFARFWPEAAAHAGRWLTGEALPSTALLTDGTQ